MVLGFLGGFPSWPLGINASGQIVGSSLVTAGEGSGFHAFLKNPGQPMQDLGTNRGWANGINASGQIVGWSYTGAYPVQGWADHAFLKNPGQPMQDLGTLGGYRSEATGINDSGQIVGGASTASGAYHAFLKNPGQPMQDLGTMGGSSSGATGINASGQIVGSAYIIGGAQHAFLKNPGQPTQDLGTLVGGYRSWASGINDSGQIVGGSNTASGGSYHAFLKNLGQPMQDLETMGGYSSEATGINASGQIVGKANTASGADHAFLKNLGQPMQDLNVLTVNLPQGVSLVSAHAINDTGYIVGHNSLQSGFLLTPIQKVFLEFGAVTAKIDFMRSELQLDKPAFVEPSQGFEDRVINKVKEAFSNYVVEFTTVKPDKGEFSTVYIGGGPSAEFIKTYNFPERGAGGSPIDPGNINKSDNIVVFPDRFPDNYSETYLANVITHEVGHSLGLLHVIDSNQFMYPYVLDNNGIFNGSSWVAVIKDKNVIRDTDPITGNNFKQDSNVTLSNTLGRRDGNYIKSNDINNYLLKLCQNNLINIYNVKIGFVISGQEDEALEIYFLNLGDINMKQLSEIELSLVSRKFFMVGSSIPGGEADIFSKKTDIPLSGFEYSIDNMCNDIFGSDYQNNVFYLELVKKDIDDTFKSFGSLSVQAQTVPIPSTLLLLGSGLLGFVGWRRFRKG